MLSIARMKSGGESYYLNLAREDYYMKGGEPPGVWHGTGARSLGLVGNVTRDTLRKAFQGRGPDGRSLTQRQVYKGKRARQPGWDLTFNAPKSVSILWCVAEAPLRLAIEAAHEKAVTAALAYIEETAIVSRRGKQGTHVDPAAPLMALFQHSVSRALDPHLHTHVLCMNMGLRPDGTWGALRSQDIFDAKMAAGAVYRAELCNELTLTCNLAFVHKKSWVELAAIPSRLIDVFSSRRGDILTSMAKSGQAGAKAAERAAKETRNRKQSVHRRELHARWRTTIAEQGHSPEQLIDACVTGLVPSRSSELSTLRAVEIAADHFVETGEPFREQDVVRHVAEQLQARGAKAAEIARTVRDYTTDRPDLMVLDGAAGSRAFVSKGGQRVLAMLDHAIGTYGVLKPPRVARRTLDSEARAHALALDGAHLDALAYLTQSPGNRCLSGVNVQQKIHLLTAACNAWKEAGLSVVGCTPSKEASRVLRDELGIPAFTPGQLPYAVTPTLGVLASHTARQLYRASRGWRTADLRIASIGPRTVLLVEDSDRFTRGTLESLVRLAERRRAQLVLVGSDYKSSHFTSLSARLGGMRISPEPSTARSWLSRAKHATLSGDVDAGLYEFGQHGYIDIQPSILAARARLIAEWMRSRTQEWARTMIVAGTRDEAEALGRLAQHARAAAGELDLSERSSAGRLTLYGKDRVTFTESRRSLGVRAGDTGTVEAIQERALLLAPMAIVRLDKVRVVDGRPQNIRVAVKFDRSVPLRLSYAKHFDEAYGSAIQQAFVLGGDWLREPALAAKFLFHASDSTRIFMTEGAAGPDLRMAVEQGSRATEAKDRHEHEHRKHKDRAPGLAP